MAEHEQARGGIVGDGVVIRMFQPSIRLSTISSAGTAHSIAPSTSAVVSFSLVRSRPMMKAISASTLGWTTRSSGISPPIGTSMSWNSMP
jgi:hypothetical protein